MEGPDPELPPGPRKYSGHTKYRVSRALFLDWQDLADIVDIPVADRERFERGREPQAVWDWLTTRGRLHQLPKAFKTMNRDDLVTILESDVLSD